MSVNVKLDVIWQNGYLSRSQTLLVFLILNGTSKTKLTILALMYCGQIMKNSNGTCKYWLNKLKEISSEYNTM